MVLRGAVIECRINAEDPARDFAPAPAGVDGFEQPGGPFVRVDSHVAPGYRIPPDYDSLLAKVIVWAPGSGGALCRMDRALAELQLSGGRLVTTAGFLRTVLTDPSSSRAAHDTALLDRMLMARRCRWLVGPMARGLGYRVVPPLVGDVAASAEMIGLPGYVGTPHALEHRVCVLIQARWRHDDAGLRIGGQVADFGS